MNKQTFSFPAQGGIIPNVPNPNSPNGEFHAGQTVEVDMDTMTVVSVRLSNAPVVEASLQERDQPTQAVASTDEAKTSKKREAK